MISMQVGLAATASLNWLIIVSGAQAENCSLSVDAERLGGLRGAGLAGERRAVAGVAAHLHVHREALADRIVGGAAPAPASAGAAAPASSSCSHVMVVPPLRVQAASSASSSPVRSRAGRIACESQMRRRRRRAAAARRRRGRR